MLDVLTKRLAVELLVKLVEVESPTFREERAVRLLEDYVNKLGFDRVMVDSVGNLLAEVGSGDRVVMLASHIDTIDEPLEARFTGDKVIGRGAVDAKGPLAAMIIAAHLASRRTDLSGLRVVVAALVGEEGPSHGAQALVGRVKADYIVVGEPTGLNGVVIGCRGSCRLMVECSGSGGHTANPQLYVSPCVDMMNIWRLLEGSRDYTMTPVYMSCGDRERLNVIPKRASMVVNVRIPVDGSVESLRSYIEGLLREFRGRCVWALSNCVNPYKANPSNPAVRAAIRALLQLGLKPRIAYKAGTSDMTILSSITGNIVEIGPGRPELSHTDFEEITVDEYLMGVELYYRIVENIASMRGVEVS